MTTNILLIFFAYFLGSLSAGIIICRAMKLEDPRNVGSRNPGATNVFRMHGGKAGIMTLLGDVIKGIIPVVCAKYVGISDWVIAATCFSVFLGHLYPIFFQFRGGKGVATLLGVLTATFWVLGLFFLITWVAIALLFRYSSIASIIAAILAPVYAFWLTPDLSYVISFSIIALLLLLRHRNNIEQLVAGTEPKITNSTIE